MARLGHVLLLLGTAALAGCAVEQPSGAPPVDLVTDRVTWVSTDGYDGRVRVLLEATGDAEGVVVEADVSALQAVAEITAPRGCTLAERLVQCRIGDLADGDSKRLAVLDVDPYPGAEQVRVPLSVRTRTSAPRTRRSSLHFVTGPQLLAASAEPVADRRSAQVRPALLNVGAEPAEGVHLVVEGPVGARFTSSYSNCRPVLPDERVAVCTFDQTVAAHEAVRTTAPLEFELTGPAQGSVQYIAGVGARDPDGLGELGPAEGTAPELLLQPAPVEDFRSPTGSIREGGLLEVRTPSPAPGA